MPHALKEIMIKELQVQCSATTQKKGREENLLGSAFAYNFPCTSDFCSALN